MYNSFVHKCVFHFYIHFAGVFVSHLHRNRSHCKGKKCFAKCILNTTKWTYVRRASIGADNKYLLNKRVVHVCTHQQTVAATHSGGLRSYNMFARIMRRCICIAPCSRTDVLLYTSSVLFHSFYFRVFFSFLSDTRQRYRSPLLYWKLNGNYLSIDTPRSGPLTTSNSSLVTQYFTNWRSRSSYSFFFICIVLPQHIFDWGNYFITY